MDKILSRSENLMERAVGQNVTIFSPTDEVLMDYEDDRNKQMVSIGTSGSFQRTELSHEQFQLWYTDLYWSLKLQNEIPVMGEDSREVESKEIDGNEILSHHMINGLYRTGDFHNNMLLPTINNGTSIRINVYNYPEKVITANCAPIVVPNNYASNAVIHLVGRIIPKPKSTILELIQNDPRFSILMKRKSTRAFQSKLDLSNPIECQQSI